MNNRPLIIALEGLPGAGKTTLMTQLDQQFQDIEGVNQILPSDLPDENITLKKIFSSEELKTQRCKDSTAKVIILDRYYQSALAYHYASDIVYGGSSLQQVESWCESAVKTKTLVKPDHTLVIDVDPIKSVKRKGRRLTSGGDNPWIRSDFLENMREYYINIAGIDEESCILVDGDGKINDIKHLIIRLIEQRVGKIK